jgi:hypothetical protein
LPILGGKCRQQPPGGTKSNIFFFFFGYFAPAELGTFIKMSFKTGL